MAGENPAAQDWAGARGDKWCIQLEHMEGMLSGIDQELIQALELNADMQIADIGCGGGGPTIGIARAAPKGCQIYGLDISPALIETAKTRIQATGLPIQFIHTDVADFQPEQPLDRLFSRFGIMFYDDPKATFQHLAKWLKPDGRLVFASWADPALNPWMLSVREAVSRVIDIPSMDPAAPGPFRYAEPEGFLSILQQAGFKNLQCRQWSGQLPIGGGMSAQRATDFVLDALSVGELLAEAGPIATEAAKKNLQEIFAANLRDGLVWMDACVNIFTGSGP